MRLPNTLLCHAKRVGKLTKDFANLPEAYIKRTIDQVEWKTPNLPNYLQREVKKKAIRFTTNRPWTDQFRRQQERVGTRCQVFVEPIKDWTIFKGDRVEVLVGRDKGKIGVVSQVIQERNWVIVTGLNWHYRRIGKRDDYSGTVVRSEAPLLVTNQVALLDPADNKQTKVEFRYTEDGEKVRVSIRTGRIIPMPGSADETYDYKIASAYLESVKDTKSEDVQAITFEPKLKTFEMDIMESMGIKEDRIPKKSYWY